MDGTFKDYREEGYEFTAKFKNNEKNYKLPDRRFNVYYIRKADLIDISSGIKTAYDGTKNQ